MLLNYTTSIPAEQTIGEIQKMLADHGVTSMKTDYEGRNVSAVSFLMEVKGKQIGFKMPCNWRAVKDILNNEPKIVNTKLNSNEQAIRTAWRIIHVWVKAQLALVEVNMVTIPQIFLPYSIMHDGKTLAEHVSEDPSFLLANGN